MSLGNQMSQMLASGPQYNTQPLQELQQNAENPNASPWAQLQSQLARSNTAQAGSQAANQTAASTAQAQGNLALSGGLSSGANERTQEAGEQAGIGAQQNVANAGNQQQMQIGIQDAANKQQEQMALPGMETQAYEAGLQPIQMMGQADAQDIAHQMAGTQALNQFNMGAYGNQASMYGANQTANAQENAANNTGGLFGGGGFLGMGSWLCTERGKIKPLTQEEKSLLAHLLRVGRKVERDFLKWYLSKGKDLVSLIKSQDPNWAKDINVPFIDHVLFLLKSGEDDKAISFYKNHVYGLCHKYWIGKAWAA